MRFSPKKDWTFRCIIWGLIFFFIIMQFIGGEPIGRQLITYNSVFGRVITGCMIFFLAWLWFGVGYRIEGNDLIVTYGPFKKKISIQSIHSIRKTKNPFTAPALSIDRLEIMYGKYDCIQIAPKDQLAFIETLQGLHPRIKVERNKLS